MLASIHRGNPFVYVHYVGHKFGSIHDGVGSAWAPPWPSVIKILLLHHKEPISFILLKQDELATIRQYVVMSTCMLTSCSKSQFMPTWTCSYPTPGIDHKFKDTLSFFINTLTLYRYRVRGVSSMRLLSNWSIPHLNLPFFFFYRVVDDYSLFFHIFVLIW